MAARSEGKRRRWPKRLAIGVAVVLAVAAIGFAWYVNDYYHADETALAAIADENGAADGVVVQALEDGSVAFVPDEPVAGLVFYPGGKVQPEAYAPLLYGCAERGIACILTKPLFNLAILSPDMAAGLQQGFPGIDEWIIAGHSLGGVVACNYVAGHAGEFDGIVLLAAYPAVDLTGYDGAVLSIVGSEDQVLDRGKYEAARPELPADARETVIEGGNHGQFGDYGEQAGDGQAAISRAEQQRLTADAIASLLQPGKE